MTSLTREHYDGRASLELAENLDFEFSAEAMRSYIIKRTALGRLRSAWHHVEFGVNHMGEMSNFERLECFDCARSLTKMILEKPDAHMNTHLEALVLASYLPVFKKRAFDETIVASDCEDIYYSLGNALAYIKPLQIGAVPPTLSLEALALALSARTRRPDYLLYPTSPREEASEAKVVNHDSYFMKEGSKLPIQQKLIPTATQYADPVTMLTLLPLIEKASHRAGYVIEDDVSDKLNNTIALTVAETCGEELAKYEKRFMDSLSQGVVAHYREAASRVETNRAA